MLANSTHPLCCMINTISTTNTSIDDDARSPPSPTMPRLSRSRSVAASDGIGQVSGGGGVVVAGVLYKWTNYSKGWRSRWFVLRNGLVSYSQIVSDLMDGNGVVDGVRIIGDKKEKPRLLRVGSCGGNGSRRRQCRSNDVVVHLKVSSFRESKSDDRKFYIFTATKTLHLRTNTRTERVAWIEALASSRSVFFLRNDNFLVSQRYVSFSTERLKKRLIEEGADESLVKECEQIMLTGFSDLQGQLKALCEERSNLSDAIRQLVLESPITEVETSKTEARGCQVTNYGFSGLGHRDYLSIDYSTTESSDYIEKLDLDEVSEEKFSYYDTEEFFSGSPVCRVLREGDSHSIDKFVDFETQAGSLNTMCSELCKLVPLCSSVERRTKLPDPMEKEKGVSLWSIIKDNVGKDLTRVCLPVYFNEPLSSLQKCCEDLEYSYLLDRAYEHGKVGNSLLRALYVAAFAVSGYASSKDRPCKPFNPLLGETYEADYPEKGIRFFSEKVCHHPTVIACHCEGKGWKFWGDSNVKAKFWGQSIQVDPVGVLTLQFDDGETFKWSKVTTSINNLILGKVYCDHHGLMHIHGNRQHSCQLKFKRHSFIDRIPNQVHGFVEDATGSKVATIFGKWDESIHFVISSTNTKHNALHSVPKESLLWEKSEAPPCFSRYNLTSFAITLNELTPGLQENLPPTDSRLRPDQRHLENGEYEKANSEKLRLEQRQRMSRKLQENGWKPKWFEKDGEDGSYRYTGGYWETRENGEWDECPNIFGEFGGVLDECSEES